MEALAAVSAEVADALAAAVLPARGNRHGHLVQVFPFVKAEHRASTKRCRHCEIV